MGLLSIFKKKSTNSTFPENALEECFKQATLDINYRKGFYQKILWSDLLVLTDGKSDIKSDMSDLEGYVKVMFVAFDNGHVPIFTSANRIFDKGKMKGDVSYMSFKGQHLFDIAKGVTFILNPYSDYVKEFGPSEIESLMNGTIYDEIDRSLEESRLNQEFNKTFERASKLQSGLIYLDGYKKKNLSEPDKLKLEQSVEHFQKCLSLIPDHWQAMVLMAKSLQRLGRHGEALEKLELAFNLELTNHTIPMEAALEAMHLEDFNKAIFFSNEALKRNPNDFILMGNHAMNLVILGRDNEALSTIEGALKIQPNDPINQKIELMVKDVVAGRRKRPTFEDSL